MHADGHRAGVPIHMAFRSLDRSGAYGGTLGMVCLACNAFTIPLQFSTRSCLASSRHRDRTNFLKPSHTSTCPSLGVVVVSSIYEFPLMTYLLHVILGCEVTATLMSVELQEIATILPP